MSRTHAEFARDDGCTCKSFTFENDNTLHWSGCPKYKGPWKADDPNAPDIIDLCNVCGRRLDEDGLCEACAIEAGQPLLDLDEGAEQTIGAQFGVGQLVHGALNERVYKAARSDPEVEALEDELSARYGSDGYLLRKPDVMSDIMRCMAAFLNVSYKTLSGYLSAYRRGDMRRVPDKAYKLFKQVHDLVPPPRPRSNYMDRFKRRSRL